MTKNLAPVSITVYTRINHFAKTIEALKRNSLADKTVLYIFSDGPKIGDEEAVKKVRNYAKNISGFDKVIIHEQASNNYEKNIRDAYRIPLDEFGKIIRMEDDIVTSPNFLEYMNDALSKYKDDENVFAINSYTPSNCSQDPEMLTHDVYLSRYFNAWGYATWKNKNFITAREKNDFYSEAKKNPEYKEKIKKINPHMLNILELIELGRTNPGDYKITAYMLLKNLFVIRPIISLCQNIGSDGSGHGKVKSSLYDVQLKINFQPKLRSNLSYNHEIDDLIYKHYFQSRKINSLKYKILLKIMLAKSKIRMLYI